MLSNTAFVQDTMKLSVHSPSSLFPLVQHLQVDVLQQSCVSHTVYLSIIQCATNHIDLESTYPLDVDDAKVDVKRHLLRDDEFYAWLRKG